MLDCRDFSAEDFARSHPGGNIGRRLLTRVKDIMRTGDAVPSVTESTTLNEALLEITKKGMGLTAITDEAFRPIGIFTDGDLRRTFASGVNAATAKISDVMHANPSTIPANQLAVEALELMDTKKLHLLLQRSFKNTRT